MSVKLNTKQQQVFDQLKKFVKDTVVDTFILNGYAGTGKTFLVQHFAAYLKKNKIKFKLLASTGRAAAVLRGKTDFETSTIHGALYKFAEVTGDDASIPDDAPADAFGQMTLRFEAYGQLPENCIYIVDESSMIASEFTESNSYAQFGSGCLLPDMLHAIGKNKIIFVGDPAQLPPVFQLHSPALDKNWLNQNGRMTVIATLDEIMRTEDGNDILEVASAIREQIGVVPNSRWIKMPALGKNNCRVLPDPNTVFLEYFTKFLQFGPKKCVAVAHSNKACNYLNRYFRKKLFPNKDSLLEVGEVLMVAQNNYLVPLTNGDFVEIVQLGEISERAGLQFRNVRVRHIDSEKEYQIKLALDPFAGSLANLSPDQQRDLMIDFSRRMRRKGIRPKSEQYNEAMRKDAYLNSLRATYGYVVTCHKAQGGEWKEVFLFLDKGMYGYMSADAMRRWWYTAVTRAKENLYLHQDFWIK